MRWEEGSSECQNKKWAPCSPEEAQQLPAIGDGLCWGLFDLPAASFPESLSITWSVTQEVGIQFPPSYCNRGIARRGLRGKHLD